MSAQQDWLRVHIDGHARLQDSAALVEALYEWVGMPIAVPLDSEYSSPEDEIVEANPARGLPDPVASALTMEPVTFSRRIWSLQGD